MKRRWVRLSVNINDETAAVLHDRKSQGTTATETVRRAVSLYDHLIQARDGGSEIHLVDADGNRTRIELM